MSDTRPGPLRGILLMLAAMTFFSVMAALVKAADRIPAGQAVFFRAFFSIPVVFLWLAWIGELAQGVRTKDWRPHAVRGLAGSCAMGLGFASLKLLPLPEVTALRFVTPVLMVIFAAMLLGERIRMIRITAVLVGLLGVVIISAPRFSVGGTESEMIGVAMVLVSATLAALAQIFVKSMAATESTAAIVFYFAATAATLSLFTIPFGWLIPTPAEAALLIGAGLVGGCGQILLTSCYRYADAGTVAPFTYVTMIWSIVIGYFIFSEVPTMATLAGSALIIAAGVVIVYRERQLGRKTVSEGKVSAKGLQ